MLPGAAGRVAEVRETLRLLVLTLAHAELWSCRYKAEQMELLEKKTKTDEREMTYFLKILKTCKEIK